MRVLEINGPCELHGIVELSGAKNAALPCIVAALLSENPVELHGLPNKLKDVQKTYEILDFMGVKYKVEGSSLYIDDTSMNTSEVPHDLACRIRYSLLFFGLLLAKKGEFSVGIPGGCKLGDRKFDLHIEGLRKLGADIREYDDHIEGRADKLVGADVEFSVATTSGTENIMIAACLAEGHTRILNAHTRPEIVDLAKMLNKFGAKIQVFNRRIEIDGPAKITGGNHMLMKAWDEAVTFIAAASICRTSICIKDFDLSTIQGDSFLINQAGIELYEWCGDLYVKSPERIKPFHLVTGPYPAVNSDMQPIFAALASQAEGESTITDQRFPERFGYVEEFQKMGVDIMQFGNCSVVNGPCSLKGADVYAHDLRCGASLAIAAVGAQGTTRIKNLQEIERGYEDIGKKLRGLGADVKIYNDVECQ